MVRILLLSLLIISCVQKEEGYPVGATTSMIGSIVKSIGKDRVEAITIVPAGMCPGHFDLKPKEIDRLSHAKIILNHGFEGWLKKLALALPEVRIETVGVKGSWMVPEIHLRAAEVITRILSLSFPEDSALFQSNLRSYRARIDSIVKQFDRSKFKGVKVICARYQAPFLSWVGFDVVATYGRPEDLSPKELARLIDLARGSGARLVVDNLQSGPDAGRPIAEAASINHLVLTNFPIDQSYPQTLIENMKRLDECLSHH
ncbi:hypothetical protein DRP53_00430 [candidate division WOR-3 bacterium]|uniref:Zinc ABC transporter substrate-binding protein n=1 Tax=candidate division WOR-3 bacterium TaxID=2052148 RepID=A0A660SNV9_UNCW3|nr:MAG: hypothetical protein DRP53_00430 [candidate division WOR-3 bacterium]